MMPYVQGEPKSVPEEYAAYNSVLKSVFIKRGDIGFLTIDESPVEAGKPQRGQRARYPRALHTEAGIIHKMYLWGGTWGGLENVTLDRDVRVLLANSIDDSCAVWDREHPDTSSDGDIGYASDRYPYGDAVMMKAGDVYEIGILTPHESLPVKQDANRQFLRIVSSGVHGREPYFTENPLLPL